MCRLKIILLMFCGILLFIWPSQVCHLRWTWEQHDWIYLCVCSYIYDYLGMKNCICSEILKKKKSLFFVYVTNIFHVCQKVSECIKQSTDLWQRRTLSDAEFVLGVVDEALMISSYSEKLLEIKADVLFMVSVWMNWCLNPYYVCSIITWTYNAQYILSISDQKKIYSLD